MPIPIDAGSEGGTAIVIESQSFKIISFFSSIVLRSPGNTPKKPRRDMPPRRNTNL